MKKLNGHEVFDVDTASSADIEAIKKKYAELWNFYAQLEQTTEDGNVRRWCAMAKSNLEVAEAMGLKAMKAIDKNPS